MEPEEISTPAAGSASDVGTDNASRVGINDFILLVYGSKSVEER